MKHLRDQRLDRQKRTRSHSFVILVLAFWIVGAVMAGCANEPAPHTIAAVLPLTGPAAEFGQDMQRGHELAVEYYNARYGSDTEPVEVVFSDSQANPAVATNAVQSLLARGHDIFIVPLSAVGMAVRPILTAADAIAFLDAAHPALTLPPHPHIFRHSQTAPAEAAVLAPAAVEAAGPNDHVLFYQDDEYGRAFVEAIADSAGSEAFRPVPFDAATSDFRSLVQASDVIQGTGAAIVVGAGRPMGLLIRSLREQGYAGPVFASLGYIATGAADVLGDDRGDISYTDLRWRSTEPVEWMTGQYKARYGTAAPTAAVIEFQTALLLARAVGSVETEDLDAVADAVRDLAPEVVGTSPSPNNDIHPVVVLRREGNTVGAHRE